LKAKSSMFVGITHFLTINQPLLPPSFSWSIQGLQCPAHLKAVCAKLDAGLLASWRWAPFHVFHHSIPRKICCGTRLFLKQNCGYSW
jgi:hypothetical protein